MQKQMEWGFASANVRFLSPECNFIFRQDVVCVEAVKVDDLDASAVTANFEAAKSAAASATPGSQEEAEAQIDMEVNKSMGSALGLTLG